MYQTLLMIPLLIGITLGGAERTLEALQVDCRPKLYASSAESSSETGRQYRRPLTKEEKEHVHFIICTMGYKSLPSIWKDRSSLKKAGDKIDHLHPLCFLLCIFTDEETKAAMSNLKGRDFVWGEFKKGLFTTLTEETKNQNMSPSYIKDFAEKLNIDSHLILRPLQQQRWDEFVGLLIKHVPRAGDPKRYDM